jgi:phage shock protein E
MVGIVAVALMLSPVTTACRSSSATGEASAKVVVASGQHLSVADFATLTQTPAVVVLDVRTPAEYAAGHLRRAVDLDVRSAVFTAKLAELDKAATYAVYCHSGNRSGAAVGQMTAAGFTHVADLTGGITAWTADGRPVVGDTT